MRNTPKFIKNLKPNEVFVFGSNTQGRHGRGAALHALQWGAKYGIGVGHQGQTYAIPTRSFDENGKIYTLTKDEIREHVDQFISYAKNKPEFTFLVTKIGTGLASLKIDDIAPLFIKGVFYPNIYFPEEFWIYWRGLTNTENFY